MWSGYPQPGSSFFTDDALNQELADKYGIVISTSHHEPMQRSMSEWHTTGKGSWNWEKNKASISDYFDFGASRAQPFESIVTLGMRGESDGEIDSLEPKTTLKDVIRTQRDIIQRVYGSPGGVKRKRPFLIYVDDMNNCL
jgi:Glycosyl hydrolase family 115